MTVHRTILACFIFAVACIGCATNPQPPKAKSPVLVSFQGFVTEGEHRCAQFVVSNCTSRAVWYSGYGSGSPIYQSQFLEENGWKNVGAGWCDFGMSRFNIPAHRTITFTVWASRAGQEGPTMRVGVSCSPKKQEEHDTIYWSEKVEPMVALGGSQLPAAASAH